ncbi:hypothetical protein RMR21_012075 [Agrobacterium sp. rho-8.1]|nr:hypothetical protein [Agrobacterium sp. rho-8.1]
MAYDWSGNTVRQKRDDRVVVLAVVALVLLMTLAPMRIMRVASPTVHIIDTTSLNFSPPLAKL